MSELIEITPEGLIETYWNGDREEWLTRRPNPDSIWTTLRYVCAICQGTTLADLFKAVDDYPALKIFMAQYSWCRDLHKFHEQAVSIGQDSSDSDPVHHLEVRWHAEVDEIWEKVTHPGGHRERIRTIDFEATPDFIGLGAEPDNPTRYSVSLTPMWELAHLPILLNEKVTVREKFNPQVHNPNNMPKVVLEAKRVFTLLQVLDAIYGDISFYGGPDQAAKFVEELRQLKDEALEEHGLTQEMLDEKEEDDGEEKETQ